MAEWSWKITADACAICRNSLMEPSIEYQANPVSASEDGLSVSWGTCGHVFHLDCISKWVMKGTRTHCPLCSKEWDIQKIDKVRARRGSHSRLRAASLTPPVLSRRFSWHRWRAVRPQSERSV